LDGKQANLWAAVEVGRKSLGRKPGLSKLDCKRYEAIENEDFIPQRIDYG